MIFACASPPGDDTELGDATGERPGRGCDE